MLTWIVVVILVLTAALLFYGAVKLERYEKRNPWIHPPDDDGITLLEDIEDADSGKSL